MSAAPIWSDPLAGGTAGRGGADAGVGDEAHDAKAAGVGLSLDDESEIPDDVWHRVIDEDVVFFENRRTGMTSWDLPPGARIG